MITISKLRLLVKSNAIAHASNWPPGVSKQSGAVGAALGKSLSVNAVRCNDVAQDSSGLTVLGRFGWQEILSKALIACKAKQSNIIVYFFLFVLPYSLPCLALPCLCDQCAS